MMAWWRRARHGEPVGAAEERLRRKYAGFRKLLSLNNECLELMAGVQEDLCDVPPRRDILDSRVTAIFEKAQGIVSALGQLNGGRYASLSSVVEGQRRDVEGYISACQELAAPRLSAWLTEIDMRADDVGGKAAALGEVKNRLGLPVPDGYVLTTESYWQFCGIPLWASIRDAIRGIDLNDLDALQAISARLRGMVTACPVPRAIEIAIGERARTLAGGNCLAVRSSAVGEGGERTFAGQFTSLINVPPKDVVDAYKRVVAERFSERALFYRLSTGLTEVDSPMAVLFLPLIRARASGIMYTRDPKDPKRDALWITATRGLGMEIAHGRMPADLFVISRRRNHKILESAIARKEHEIIAAPGGGLGRRLLDRDAATPSLAPDELRTLASWGVRLEEHFRAPQDVEWAQDLEGNFWVLQTRSLTLAQGSTSAKQRVRGAAFLAGGRSIYAGRVSGPAHMVRSLRDLRETPAGAILVMRRASPEMVEVFPRISGLVAEWGNVAGHAAALLREFKVPSVFQMPQAFERIRAGDAISLDAVQCAIYRGTLWPSRKVEPRPNEARRERRENPIGERLLTLRLLDPSSIFFRPGGCKSTHDVIRFCHEKAIEAMFALNDSESEHSAHCAKRLVASMPVNLQVIDLGGGLALDDPTCRDVTPARIVSRPFQALWKGVTHPGVTWTREMPASFSDLASVMASSLSSQGGAVRALGEKSYLLVADEYMNLNSRLAYHFTLVDACVSETPGHNYITFRFAGGAATRQRRSLRACFIEACLAHYGFLVDRRGDLVNAWFKKAPAAQTEEKLDIIGRLMACTSQLDMYMTGQDVMKWYVEQFLRGNYAFRASGREDGPATGLRQ